MQIRINLETSLLLNKQILKCIMLCCLLALGDEIPPADFMIFL